jgi:hypothetical protein
MQLQLDNIWRKKFFYYKYCFLVVLAAFFWKCKTEQWFPMETNMYIQTIHVFTYLSGSHVSIVLS